jgi:hypothetical protein
MKLNRVLRVSSVLAMLAACGDDDTVECGQGTELIDGQCIPADAGVSQTPDAGVKDGGATASLKCGAGTKAVAGECVPDDGSVVPAALRLVGAACTASSDCQTGTCAPAAGNLPGGYCTILGCNMDNPCPVGSTCYALNKNLSLCMAYCDRDTQCRSAEDYHCQPLYTTALNICAPACDLTKSCSAGTRCNPDSGLCELAQCDVGAPGNACSDEETCWPDSKGLSAKGGLCLHLCNPAQPEKNCLVDKNEVCQPLASDPANKGFCAPPVCSKSAECPAGAICNHGVCQPPPLCNSDKTCTDGTKTCVSGKCMTKCPTDSTICAGIHPGLVCAEVLSVPACLPLASFPGSACRSGADNRCDNVTVGQASVPMVCEDNTCIADCSVGGQGVCSALSENLLCAHGIFSSDLCLPKGSFPGGACGPNNSCAQNLQGDPAVDMQCVHGTCVVGCGESGKWSGYGDALCSLVDPTLTCATRAGEICVRACGSNASCETGYSCLDSGSLPVHENACLPDGTFPGSACRPSSGDACDSNVGGNAAVDMVCANQTCVVQCPGDNDALCGAVDSRLTCAQSAGHLCVFSCASGACPSGYACLDPGGSGHENACLPVGSFPGSACRAESGNECDQNLGGSSAVDMVCVNAVCAISCPTNNDALCGAVDARLTCSESAGSLCVFSCVSGACPNGYSCLDAGGSGHQNACLPTGSFPSSPCRSESGNECDQNLGGNAEADMSCVNEACVVNCPINNDPLCSAIDSRLTCSESAGNLCVFSCVTGLCPSGYSCLDAGSTGHQNACLPTGSFPSSPCRAASGDQCDQNLGGNPGIDMVCVNETCVVSCPGDNNGLCAAVNSHLTCAAVAGNLCLIACVGGQCPPGYACYGPETVCLPQ